MLNKKNILLKITAIFVVSIFFATQPENSGEWTETNNGLTNLKVVALNLMDNMLYAGTDGGGIFYTVIGENNWITINNGLTIYYIKALHSMNGVLYAAFSGGGIFKTTDKGVNWILPNNNGLYVICMTTSLHSMNDILYAGTGHGVYKTNDEGDNWEHLGLNKTITALHSLENILYVSTIEWEGQNEKVEVFKTTDEGATWNSLLNLTCGITSLYSMKNALYAGTYSNGVYKTTDEGASWTRINTGLMSLDILTLCSAHNTLYAGTREQGVFKSTDEENQWSPINNGLAEKVKITNLCSTNSLLYAVTIDKNTGDPAGVFVYELSTNPSSTSWLEKNWKTVLAASASVVSLISGAITILLYIKKCLHGNAGLEEAKQPLIGDQETTEIDMEPIDGSSSITEKPMEQSKLQQVEAKNSL